MNTHTWTRVRDWSVLSALLVVALAIMLSVNTPILRGVRALGLEVTADVEQLFAGTARYFRALEENQSLRRQNMDLASQVARMREAQIENRRLRELLELKEASDLPLQATEIVSMDITRQQNYCIIDIGAADSVEKGMPVLTENGVLGLITMTSSNYSVVQTYLHTDFRISAMIEPLQSTGIVRWDGNDPNQLLLQHVVKTEEVEPGQRVVTSGYSNRYPRGIPIGVVDSVRTLPGRNELLVTITPSAALHQSHYAFVLMEGTDEEFRALEQNLEQNIAP